ncbi:MULTISPECIES: nicotinamide riboside transporter PnuC [unclassified Prevotella]|uniref:nicotinamide riboside transporter PnuC n=1 Tax=unclassified Prevotella TaxID=2638335 RepID=UPI00048DD9A4|nr:MULTISPECIES: nicotinamide riboside transporter PnuC [unclassified Prevotella]
MAEFISAHWLDITTTILGLLYILFEYRASVWLWLVGFLMQALGIVLYYQKGLYADCGMEFYYLSMTVYGYLKWVHGSAEKKALPITHFPRKLIIPWLALILAIWGTIYWLLVSYTNSNVPLADSFTTALSIVGIWALAHKYLEQWFIWIIVDIVTCFLYFYKDIPFKAGLYALYVIIAIFGYKKWKNMIDNRSI